MDQDIIILAENHKRSLSSTLIVVEQLLIDMQHLMVNSSEGCCYEINKDVDNETIDHNNEVIDEALSLICLLKEKYNTEKTVQSLQRVINAKKTKIWETLNNSKSRRMKGFGEFPQKLIKEYDNDLDNLISISEKLRL